MITVSAHVVINRPVEEVFPQIADPVNHLKWDKGGLQHVEKLNKGPLGVGAKYHFTEEDAGKFDVEITEFEPPRHLIQHFKMKYGDGKHKFELIPIPEGTRLHQEIHISPKGFYKMFGSKIKDILKDRIEISGERIKLFFEKK